MTATAYKKDESLAYHIRMAVRGLVREFNSAVIKAGYHVTDEQWIILSVLWEKEGINQQELSNLSDRDKTSITRLIDALEKNNIVVRVPDKSDRRNKLIYLTKKGRDLEQGLGQVALSVMEKALSGLTDEHIETSMFTLKKIIKNTST
jgi:DNA-binding MarR family transcriptional regulator